MSIHALKERPKKRQDLLLIPPRLPKDAPRGPQGLPGGFKNEDFTTATAHTSNVFVMINDSQVLVEEFLELLPDWALTQT